MLVNVDGMGANPNVMYSTKVGTAESFQLRSLNISQQDLDFDNIKAMQYVRDCCANG